MSKPGNYSSNQRQRYYQAIQHWTGFAEQNVISQEQRDKQLQNQEDKENKPI
jgi:hypothetical protein